jgi:hypothetical protein
VATAGAAGAQDDDAAMPQTGGKVVDTPRQEDDRSFLSPPIIVEPLLGCGSSVTVMGFRPDAQIAVLESGATIGGGPSNKTWGETFPVSPHLVTDQLVTATQTFGGVTSLPSPVAKVKDHTVVYPAGLPPPELPALPLYRCGIATVASSLPPGGVVRVKAGAPGAPPAVVGQVDGVEARQSIGIGAPFEEGHHVFAESQICSDVSPPSATTVVQPAPATLPAPEVADVTENGSWLVVGKLVNGARVTIKKGGATIGGGGAPAGVVRFPMSSPLPSQIPPRSSRSSAG